MAPDLDRPVLPYMASNVLERQGFVTRALMVIAVVLVVIELSLFFVPKVIWAFTPGSEWASISLVKNPLREEVFDQYALNVMRDAKLGIDILSTQQSLRALDDETMAQIPREKVDYLDCAFPFSLTNLYSNYETNRCAYARTWLIERDLYQEVARKPYTFVTATFLHAGLLHLAFNVCALFVLARLAMLRMGFARFMLFFLCAGVMGFLMHAGLRGYLRGSSGNIVGASGAIMACLGLHWRLIYDRTKRQADWVRPAFYSPNKQLFKQVTAFLWADLLFIITASFISGEAHIGGLIFGFLAGPLFLRSPVAHRRVLKQRVRGPILHSVSEETPA